MRTVKKLLVVTITAVIVLGLFKNVRLEAAEIGTPKISLKYVNSKTGVEIIIGKTMGADAYRVYLKGCGDSYVDYWTDYSKNELWREVALIEKNGKAKRSYTIKGLPKGTYSIKVAALTVKMVYDDGSVYYEERSYSTEKNVKLKASNQVKVKEKTYDFSKAKVGSTITFGSYEQDGIMTNGKEDIEWIVLSKTKSQMLVLSKYALDCLPYNNELKDTTWENCTLRKWLNNNFYKTAFTKAERSLIKKTKLKNTGNPYYGIEGGNDTKDNVFSLSLEDIVNTKYGFDSNHYVYDKARICTPTVYAIANGAYQFIGENWFSTRGDCNGACFWWLRSPGYSTSHAVGVNCDGSVYEFGGSYGSGCEVTLPYHAVRPAVVLKL